MSAEESNLSNEQAMCSSISQQVQYCSSSDQAESNSSSDQAKSSSSSDQAKCGLSSDQAKCSSSSDQAECSLSDERAKSKSRRWEIDLVRGICLVYVSIFHFCYMGYFLLKNEACHAILKNVVFSGLHFPVVYTLLFVSGISRAFTKNPKKRVFKIGGCALAISYTTLLATRLVEGVDKLLIVFGILHSLTVCMIVYELIIFLLAKLKLKERTANVILISIAAVIVVVGILFSYKIVSLASDTPIWMVFFVNSTMSSAFSPGDFFPIIPLLGFYILGAVFANQTYKKRGTLIRKAQPVPLAPIVWCGRHSLPLYIAVPIASMLFFGLFLL